MRQPLGLQYGRGHSARSTSGPQRPNKTWVTVNAREPVRTIVLRTRELQRRFILRTRCHSVPRIRGTPSRFDRSRDQLASLAGFLPVTDWSTSKLQPANCRNSFERSDGLRANRALQTKRCKSGPSIAAMLKRLAQATKQYLERGAPGHDPIKLEVGTTASHNATCCSSESYPTIREASFHLQDGERPCQMEHVFRSRVWGSIRGITDTVSGTCCTWYCFCSLHAIFLYASICGWQQKCTHCNCHSTIYIGVLCTALLMLLIVLCTQHMQHVLQLLLYVLVLCTATSSSSQLQSGADV